MQKFDLKSDLLFPFPIPLLGFAMVIVGAFVVIVNYIAAPIIIFFGAVLITGRQGIVFSETDYSEYYSFITFIRFSRKKSMKPVEKIFINASKVSQKVNTMVTTGITTRNIEYSGYLKFEDGNKLYLKSRKNKESLIEELQALSDFLNTQLEDRTK